MTSFLRSVVTDIVYSLCPCSKVKNTKRSQLTFRHFGERNRLAFGGREIDRQALDIRGLCRFPKIMLARQPLEMREAKEDGVAAAEADRICGRYGQRRDAVQHGRDGGQMLQSGRTMPKSLQLFQRNCVLYGKGPKLEAAQGNHVAK